MSHDNVRDPRDPKDEIAILATRADALRAAIARAQLELTAAAAEERAISDRLTKLTLAKDAISAGANEPNTTHEATAIAKRRHLTRNDAWKVALAGAAAATLFGAIGLTIYAAATSSSSPPTAVVVLPPTTVGPPTASIVENDTPPEAPPEAAPVAGEVIGVSPPVPPARIPESVRRARDFPRDPDALAGALTIVCMPRCDEIIDNGVSIGPGHVFNRPSTVGRHVLSLGTANGIHKTLRVDVVADQTREVRVSMESSRTTASQRNCDPPFFIDIDGNKHFKPECLRHDPVDDRF